MSASGLPEFESLDELVECFDTHDMGDDGDEMPEARMDVEIQRRVRLIARSQHVAPEKLVNAWV